MFIAVLNVNIFNLSMEEFKTLLVMVNAPVQPTGLGELKLNVSGLEKGIYSLELNDGIKRVNKVIVE
mgnify:CR=1 FL=1